MRQVAIYFLRMEGIQLNKHIIASDLFNNCQCLILTGEEITRFNGWAECFNQNSLAVQRKAIGSVAEIIDKHPSMRKK